LRRARLEHSPAALSRRRDAESPQLGLPDTGLTLQHDCGRTVVDSIDERFETFDLLVPPDELTRACHAHRLLTIAHAAAERSPPGCSVANLPRRQLAPRPAPLTFIGKAVNLRRMPAAAAIGADLDQP